MNCTFCPAAPFSSSEPPETVICTCVAPVKYRFAPPALDIDAVDPLRMLITLLVPDTVPSIRMFSFTAVSTDVPCAVNRTCVASPSTRRFRALDIIREDPCTSMSKFVSVFRK